MTESKASTDNLEAGAGDLVARQVVADFYRCGGNHSMAAEIISDHWEAGASSTEKDLIAAISAALAAQLAAVTAENARLREALTMARDEYGFDMNDEQLSMIEAAISQEAPK